MNAPDGPAGAAPEDLATLVQQLAETAAALEALLTGAPDVAPGWLAAAPQQQRRARQALIENDARSQALLRQAERAEAHFHNLLETAPDPIVATTPDGRIALINPQAEQVFGYRKEELLGLPIEALLPERFHERHRQHRRQYAGQTHVRRMGAGLELYARRSDGSEFPVEISLSPVVTSEGMLITSIIRDITRRRAVLQALRASEERYRRIVETAQEGIWVLDADSRTAFVNRRMAGMLGYSVEEMAGTPLAAYLTAPDAWVMPDGRRRPDGGRWQRDVQFVRRDGGHLWAQLSGSALYSEAGQHAGELVMVTDITARKEAEAALQRQALFDSLTGLPNRVLLFDRLHQAVRAAARQGTGPALLLLDLDRFKDVNDTFGHPAGDLLLQQVGARLVRALREADTVARLGGDEFAVVLPSTTSTAEALLVAHRLLTALDAPFAVGDLRLHAGASIGVVRAPDHGADPDTLLRHADVAMYIAKRSGGGVAVYAAEQDQNSPDRLALLTDLRHALARGALRLHYQPQLDMRSGRVVGVEALARWQHSGRGPVPPAQFIALAEQSGLIHRIAEWSLEAALRQAAAWHAAGLDLRVSVNLSVRNLQDPRLPDYMAGLLARYPARHGSLQVEITESSLIADPALTLTVLSQLRDMGVQIAVDDFGTGYSSLAYLRRLPVDELKIDRSFVAEIAGRESDTVIVRSIIDLGHNLGLRVVAEGIEYEQAWQCLQTLGCDVAQGYYLSHPLHARQLEAWVRRRAAN